MKRRAWSDPDELLDEWARLTARGSRSSRPRTAAPAGLLWRLVSVSVAGFILVAVLTVVLLWRPSAGPASEDSVLLPIRRDLNSYPTALLEGTLVREGDCLYAANLYSEGRHLVIWPPGTALDEADEPAVLVDDRGQRIAAVGEPVLLGGGEYRHHQLDFLRTLLARDIPDECLGGPYWLGASARPAWGEPGPATWRVDPAQPPSPESTSVTLRLTEVWCASGRTPEGRILPPLIQYHEDRIVISLSVRQWPGDCPSNPEYPLTVELSQPIGGRSLVDAYGGERRWP